jgi:sensor histidine kinase YesM
MAAMTSTASPSIADRLAAGVANLVWRNVLLLAALNAAIALALWIEDPRPFWHPLITAQCFGFVIAYCVRVAAPWESARPMRRLVPAVAIGALLAMVLATVIKRYTIDSGYTIDYVIARRMGFLLTTWTGFVLGLLGSLIVHVRMRETRALAVLHKAEAERLQLQKHAMESELKLLQAQIEPHFLFNTLASVQYLTETDPPQASRLLEHLLAYLRAALPQMRSASTTLGQEIEFAEAYLNILRMRMGPRLDFGIDVPAALRAHPFPPVLLISIVENAVTHGLEPLAAGGHVTIAACRDGDSLVVTVTDTGAGLAAGSRSSHGVGLANVRERLAALFGARGRFTLEGVAPRGARATIEIPLATA